MSYLQYICSSRRNPSGNRRSRYAHLPEAVFSADTIDHKVKIWSTVPVLDEAADDDETNPKLLCTMTTHSGKSPEMEERKGN